MKKSLIVATIAAGIIWYGPGSAQATYCTTRTPQYCPTTTPATTVKPGEDTTTTTKPGEDTTTTVKPGEDTTTVKPGEDTTTTAKPGETTTVPTTVKPGEDTTTTAVLDESSTTAPATTIPQELPDTGGETGWIALAALVTLLTGVSVVSAARRS